jgi:hypothetical protein
MNDADEAPPPAPPVERPVPLAVHVFGWYGAAAILAMYLLNSFERVDDQGALYQLCNVTGAAGVGLICWWRRTWPAFWLEAVWAAVGLGALVRLGLGAT